MRLVSWRYHEADWGGKRDGWASWMRVRNSVGALIVNIGWQSFNGAVNTGSGVIGGNYSDASGFGMYWKRDLSSGGGSNFRFWVKDDSDTEYLLAYSSNIKTGNGAWEFDYNLPNGTNIAYNIGGSFTIRRVGNGSEIGCTNVCVCKGGNCSCFANNECACQSGRCGNYGCSCNTRCSGVCTTNNTMGCICKSQISPDICSAFCSSHTCSCNTNLKFRDGGLIYSSDIGQLINSINENAKKYNLNRDITFNPEGDIMEDHIKSIANVSRELYNKIKEGNNNLNFDFEKDVTATLPTDIDGNIKLITYRNLSNMNEQIKIMCASNDRCTSRCASYSMCPSNCVCNHFDPGQNVVEGYACPCNSQCSCNGHCNGVCVNCSCNRHSNV